MWFGTHWGAGICDTTPQVATPVGELCIHCEEPITARDSGIGVPLLAETVTQTYYHLECWGRVVLGSVGHQLRVCSCYGGLYEDPPTMTKREAARAAWENAHKAFPRHS